MPSHGLEIPRGIRIQNLFFKKKP